MRKIKNFGRKSGGVDDFEVFGVNLKFTDLQAVIGIEQMKKIDDRVQRMRDIFDLYYTNLKDVVRMIKPTSNQWIPWFIDIYISPEIRPRLIFFLKSHDVNTREAYPAIHQTNMYKEEFGMTEFPNSMYVSSNCLFLPSHTLLQDKEIKYICDLIKLFFLNNDI